MKKTAIILAGGKSKRMNTDKAFIKWVNGKSLIENQISNLSFFDEIIISGPKGKFFHLGYKVVEDENKNVGPIEGLRRGLAASKNEYNFLISCDMPFVNEDLIMYMFSVARGNDAVVCRNRKFIEPLYTIYSKRLLKTIEKNINLEKYSFQDVIFNSKTLFIPENIVRKFSQDLLVFSNLNTKDDLKKFKGLYYNNYYQILKDDF